jgi:hypothetical protein
MRKDSIAALLAALLLASGAQATDLGGGDEARRFSGLWEGIDPGDGSLTQRAITCNPDGTCAVLGSDIFFSLCSGAQGILEGSGMLEAGVLAVPAFTLSCSNGVAVSVDTTFTPDLRNATLIEQTVNPEIAAITFHRLSLPPHGRR